MDHKTYVTDLLSFLSASFSNFHALLNNWGGKVVFLQNFESRFEDVVCRFNADHIDKKL